MYKDSRILAIIPARGGSKGIPHKNITRLAGRPLISYTIEAGLNSKYIDYVMVSTDDDDIANVSRKFGAEVPFMRPAEFATDVAKTVDVVIHVVDEMDKVGEKFDVIILLQPTGPLRTAKDIDEAVEKYFQCGKRSLLSVCEVEDHPILIRSIEGDTLKPLLNVSSTCRRQDMPKYYKVNGCIYINDVSELNKDTSFNDNEIPFVMERNHSVDIDELSDLVLAEYWLLKK